MASGLMDLESGRARRLASTCPIHPTTHLFFRRAQGRRCASCISRRSMPSGSWPTSSQLRRAHPGHHQRRLHAAAWRRSCRRDGLIDHLIVCDDTAFGPSAIPTTPIDGRAGPACASTSSRADGAGGCRGTWPAVSSRTWRCCNTPAAPRASPRAPCSATPTSASTMLDLQDLGRSAAHLTEPGDGQGHLRPAAVPHLCPDGGAAARPARRQRDAAAPALRRGNDARDIEVKKATVLPRRADHVDRARQHARHRQARFLLAALSSAPAAPALPVEVAERFYRLTGHRLGGGWGMTETSPAGTSLPQGVRRQVRALSVCRCPAS